MQTAINEVPADKSAKPKRQWVYAKKPAGKLFQKRQWVGYSLLLFLFAGPFLRIQGNPLMMFNIIERKFSIFGQIFYPQDLHIFVFGMLIMLVCVVLFTVVYGRVWCGWACPQTIFMELIFRPIEYLIEGDRQQQKKLNAGPNTDRRAWKKIIKHTLFLVVSFFISNLFLAYIIGSDALIEIISDPVDDHIVGFLSITVFSLVFYAVFAHIREIVCTTICPYGRFQGVLLDDQSVTVAYDFNRGEPRGKLRKGEDRAQGDCIDCNLCVQVCPTGIDIREGLQMECVSCTACIDACDAVMLKTKKKPRLIGFYAMGELQNSGTFVRNNVRAIAYSVVLLVLMGVFGYMLFSRSLVGGTLLRATGTSYQIHDNGTVSNLYTLELINKSGMVMPFTLHAVDSNLRIQMVNPIDTLRKDGSASLSFFLVARKEWVKSYKNKVSIEVVSGDKKLERMKTTFIAPPNLK